VGLHPAGTGMRQTPLQIVQRMEVRANFGRYVRKRAWLLVSKASGVEIHWGHSSCLQRYIIEGSLQRDVPRHTLV
jgi:hypothetical protein